MPDTDLQKVNEQLEKHGEKLEKIQDTLQQIAVQDEQLRNQAQDIAALWKKYDVAFGPNGTIPVVQQHQASCPRNQIKFLWMVVVPQAFLMLGIGIKLLGA